MIPWNGADAVATIVDAAMESSQFLKEHDFNEKPAV